MLKDYPNQAVCYINLGNMLESRYKWTGDIVDLDAAIQAVQ
jgi:hypothetical protein